MRKSQIDTRIDRDTHGQELPCINVKVHQYGIYAPEVAEYFGCSEAVAEKAIEYCYESAQQQFWDEMPELAREIFGRCEVHSHGRSGGYLCVHGLPPMESWDAIMVGKWCKFANMVTAEVSYLTGRDYTLEQIEANQWAKPGAELYNFLDRAGETLCIADLKAKAIESGYGPVVRS
jgi:hypothetical protein